MYSKLVEIMTLEQLATPDFRRALAALAEKRPTGLVKQGMMDGWLERNVDTDAARAWRAYKEAEALLP